MKKDKVLAIRIPEVVHSTLSELAKEKEMTLTELVLSSLSGLTWQIELERNVEYHKMVLQKLSEVEKIMRKTQRKRSKAITGKAIAPTKLEQMNLIQ